ncbi:MAG: M28 family peptidase [Acidobacteria bacterium]|nr:M28 family peptidase [Acidobacteriota bacterium]
MSQGRQSHSRRNRLALGAGLLLSGVLVGWGALSLTRDHPNIGKTALGHIEYLVRLGPRPPASDAHRKMEDYIRQQLAAAGAAVEEDRFTADTPNGPLAMNNIVGRLRGRSQRVLILAAHYDTKWEPKFPFLGANDGGSGTGLLLALAPVLAKRNANHSVWLAFLDGEEAFREWSVRDSLYGSRRFAAKLRADGLVPQVGAFLLVDMIGDADLGILYESNSTPWLRDLVWRAAQRLGHSRHFLNTPMAIEDDHVPLLQAGVPAVNLIDFNYGPNNRYWHSREDTLDKLSPQSLQVVGEVLLEVLEELDQQR